MGPLLGLNQLIDQQRAERTKEPLFLFMVSFLGGSVSRRARQRPCSPLRLTRFFQVTAAVCYWLKKSGTSKKADALLEEGTNITTTLPPGPAAKIKGKTLSSEPHREAEEAILTCQALAPLLQV